ncbi:MAG: beta-phosphoglucomutase family hydrolase [Bifidobacteriaceae bacterium]|nr:beta-phosphoglucomutase family hydrolase [Bifidobacteriaceae bacterium]
MTADLRVELPAEDIEGLEFAAFLAAADASLSNLAHKRAPLRRVVVSADVPRASVCPLGGPERHPAAVGLRAPVEWNTVAAIHVDEAEAAEEVRAAIGGDSAALRRLEDRDLLWYAPQERPSLVAELERGKAVSSGSLLEPFRVVLFDLDGVLTPTAEIHRRAWSALFSEYLSGRGAAPFEDSDYFEYIDGRPRNEGVRALLASRGLTLPAGEPSDPPDAETVAGLGNRKNSLFTSAIAADGVAAYPGTADVLQRLAQADKSLGVVSSSANARAVLEAAGLVELFDVVVDGQVARNEGLAGKPAPDTFAFAAVRLGAAAGEAVVIEDAVAGVAAGRAGGFGLVVGVDRGTGAARLINAGADVVVGDLSELLAYGYNGRG